MSWQSMFKENKQHSQYLGFVQKIFDEITKNCKFIKVSKQKSFVQFQVKLFHMKFFLDSAL